jgi:hypothetical protein
MKSELKNTKLNQRSRMPDIDIDEDLGAFQTPDYEEAILASWNRVC